MLCVFVLEKIRREIKPTTILDFVTCFCSYAIPSPFFFYRHTRDFTSDRAYISCDFSGFTSLSSTLYLVPPSPTPSLTNFPRTRADSERISCLYSRFFSPRENRRWIEIKQKEMFFPPYVLLHTFLFATSITSRKTRDNRRPRPQLYKFLDEKEAKEKIVC